MEMTMPIECVENLEGKEVFTGLFGEQLVNINTRDLEKPHWSVACKLTLSEIRQFEILRRKFGMSKYRFARHCICQQLKDLALLLDD